jgi:heme-degrading monooxygenase HmoA
MIARRFLATATAANAVKYYAFFRDVLTPELRKIPGHLGAFVLSREAGDAVEILVLTLWESDEAIRRFAGETPSRAAVEPEARAILSAFDDEVMQYRVEVDTLQR